MSTLCLATSVRLLPAARTWAYLQAFRDVFGITRVTDTTLLDDVGIPVTAAIRPTAQNGSLCVSSGKGLSTLDAKVGALAEAIELACSEFDPKTHVVEPARVTDFEDQFDLDVYDFGVRAEFLKKVLAAHKIDLVQAHEYFSGITCRVPASLVFLPYRERNGRSLFGSSSNGLAGGNSRCEALLHATLEVLERDALSFALVSSLERRVVDIDDPRWLDLAERVKVAGLNLYVTYCDNVLGLPMFISYLFDPAFGTGLAVTRGQGMHLSREIALLRATTEAAQSRLTQIHGGRDDILRSFEHRERLGASWEVEEAEALERRLRNSPTVSYQSVPTHSVHASMEANMSQLCQNLRNSGFGHLFFVDLTRHMTDYRIVKVLIPGMEFYSPDNPRVGKRLLYNAYKSRR
jgi:ribosomal protein S12 methylthiotransferase accessory factor